MRIDPYNEINAGDMVHEEFNIIDGGGEEGDFYYKIGNFNTDTGVITYDFNAIGIASNVYTDQLNLEAVPYRSDVYSSDGGLIVFEPSLRPDYITINLEQIDNV